MSDLPDDFRICGTAQREITLLRAEQAAERAFRLYAKRGNDLEVRGLLAQALPDLSERRSSLHAAAEYFHARLSAAAKPELDLGLAIDTRKKQLFAKATELEESIAELESSAGGGSPNDKIMFVARMKTSRALIAMTLDDHVLAETLYQEAIASLSSIWGANHLEVGGYCEDYATLLFKMGRMQEATSYVARACAITTSAGFTHRDRG
jgi:tetratricopeptide (TPR) repeat protein